MDSLKPVAETKMNNILPSEIDGLSSEELRNLLKKRKDQYWNLATYMSKEMLKYFEGNVKFVILYFFNIMIRSLLRRNNLFKTH